MLDRKLFTDAFPKKNFEATNFSQFPDLFTAFRGMVERELGSGFGRDGTGCDRPPANLFCKWFTGELAEDVFSRELTRNNVRGDVSVSKSAKNLNARVVCDLSAADGEDLNDNACVKFKGAKRLINEENEDLAYSAPKEFLAPASSEKVKNTFEKLISDAEKITVTSSDGKQKETLVLESKPTFDGGESAALNRLTKFVWGNTPKGEDLYKAPLASYKDTRNRSIGDTYSSKFSMYLALGNVSARTVCHEIAKFEDYYKHRSDSTYWLVFELLWRDFMKFAYVKHGDTFFFYNGIQRKSAKWWSQGLTKMPFNKLDPKDDKTSRVKLTEYVKFLKGETGFPYVDAHMRELIKTGFMGNRGRQNIASFLIFDMKIDWRKGCELFEHFLLDHDCLSNSGNWQTIVGIGFQQRENRFNVIKQSVQYEKSGEFIKHWVPELKDIPNNMVHTPWDYGNYNAVPDLYKNPIRPSSSFFYEKNGGGGGKGKGKRGNGNGAWAEDWEVNKQIKIPSYTDYEPGKRSGSNENKKKKQRWGGK